MGWLCAPASDAFLNVAREIVGLFIFIGSFFRNR